MRDGKDLIEFNYSKHRCCCHVNANKLLKSRGVFLAPPLEEAKMLQGVLLLRSLRLTMTTQR